MRGPDRIALRLACGATVVLTVKVERRGCTDGGVGCPTAADVAGLIWLAMQDEEEQAPSPQ